MSSGDETRAIVVTFGPSRGWLSEELVSSLNGLRRELRHQGVDGALSAYLRWVLESFSDADRRRFIRMLWKTDLATSYREFGLNRWPDFPLLVDCFEKKFSVYEAIFGRFVVHVLELPDGIRKIVFTHPRDIFPTDNGGGAAIVLIFEVDLKVSSCKVLTLSPGATRRTAYVTSDIGLGILSNLLDHLASEVECGAGGTRHLDWSTAGGLELRSEPPHEATRAASGALTIKLAQLAKGSDMIAHVTVGILVSGTSGDGVGGGFFLSLHTQDLSNTRYRTFSEMFDCPMPGVELGSFSSKLPSKHLSGLRVNGAQPIAVPSRCLIGSGTADLPWHCVGAFKPDTSGEVHSVC